MVVTGTITAIIISTLASAGLSIGIDEYSRMTTTKRANVVKVLQKIVNEAAAKLNISYQDALDKITRRENDILSALPNTNAARNFSIQAEKDRLAAIRSKVNKEYQEKNAKLSTALSTGAGYEATPVNKYSEAAQEAEKLIASGLNDAKKLDTNIKTEVK